VTGPGEDPRRRLALLQETDAVKQFLQRAIASINQRDAVDVDPYATLQLLSQGVERLLKLTVIFQYHRAHARFPNDTDIKQYRHDVERLATTVLATAQADPYFAHRPAAQADIDFATANPTLRLLIDACATFGAPIGRYHHLTTATGQTTQAENSPNNLWQDIETSARGADHALLDRLASVDTETHRAAVNDINARITAIIQRYIRSVVRIWAWSPPGDAAKPFSTSMYSWLMLNDDALDRPC
jgi:hypothetical protein